MKANQITAIGVSIIAIGAIFGVATYLNKQREQRIINTYYSCMSNVTSSGRLYGLQRENGAFFQARKTLEGCLSRYGITEPDEYLIRQFLY